MTIILSLHLAARAAAAKIGETLLLIQRVQDFSDCATPTEWRIEGEFGVGRVPLPSGELQDRVWARCPFGAPGDVVGVKEAFAVYRAWDDDDGIVEFWEGPIPHEHPTPGFTGHGDTAFDGQWGPCYQADDYMREWHEEIGVEWLPAADMPEWAIRTHLRVVEPQIRRASDITIGEWVLADVDPATVAPEAWCWLTGVEKV